MSPFPDKLRSFSKLITLFALKVQLCVLLISIIKIESLRALRIERLEMPDAVRNGTINIPLQCIYRLDTNRERLYSIKWYLNNVEFFRYLPADEPQPGQSFNLLGIYLKMNECNSTHVVLRRADLYSEGTYSCEVSTDNFITATALRQLKVYFMPTEKIRIEGSKFEYEINHPIVLMCLSSPSKPMMRLNWFINDKPASPKHLVSYQTEVLSNNLMVAKLGLNFKPLARHFKPNGYLRLRCSADLRLDYWFETALYLDNTKNKVANGHYTQNELFLPQEETPVITGGRASGYRVGDTLNLTCTTVSTNAQLHWFVNDQVMNTTGLIRYSNRMLGLILILDKHHFQSDLKFKCVSTFSKQIAHSSDQVTFATQNAELLRSNIMLSASVRIHEMTIKNFLLISTFLSLILVSQLDVGLHPFFIFN